MVITANDPTIKHITLSQFQEPKELRLPMQMERSRVQVPPDRKICSSAG